jgi:nitrogen fixation protein FixH
MRSSAKRGEFTGKHMLAIMVVGFGIVVAVNLTMASFAIGGFQGTVVENSYVASQRFNRWIAQAEADRALGWSAQAQRDRAGFVTVATAGVPDKAALTAELRRPIGPRERASLAFEPLGEGTYRSTEPVLPGRWTMRLTMTADGDDWTGESALR